MTPPSLNSFLISTTVVAVVAGCAAPSPPSVVAFDDPDSTVCALITEDGTVQVAVTFVENTGSTAAELDDFALLEPTTDGLELVGAYLSAPERGPVTGEPFPEVGSGPLTLQAGAKQLIVYGLSLSGAEDAHADGLSFHADAGAWKGRVTTRMPIQVETTSTGCADFVGSVEGGREPKLSARGVGLLYVPSGASLGAHPHRFARRSWRTARHAAGTLASLLTPEPLVPH